MIAISNRNDKYIAPSFLLKIRNRKIPKTKTLKLANSQVEKGPNLYFKWLRYIHGCYHSFCKASPSKKKKILNPSISIHALWLIYFKKLFLLVFLLILWQNKRPKKHNKIVYNYFIITNKD